jgi:Raf kinase inhibitor-like YbhB/YbcL family protein
LGGIGVNGIEVGGIAMVRTGFIAMFFAFALLALISAEARAEPGDPGAMRLTSSAFTPGGVIPTRFTCDGSDVSPPLAWSQVPEGARSLALVVDDPDAPDPQAPKVTWVHWVVYNIPPESGGLGEGASSNDLPVGAIEGRNDWKRTDYGGPCPPIGRHRYVHKLYALDTVLPDLGHPTKAELLAAMVGHIVARAQLVGTYER